MPSPIAIGKKSPSFHSNKSNENMSVDGGAGNNGQENPNSYTVPSYDDHWVFEKIVLERVSGLFVYLVRGNSGRSLILKKIKKRAILGLYCLAKSERSINSSVFFLVNISEFEQKSGVVLIHIKKDELIFFYYFVFYKKIFMFNSLF